MDSIKEIFDALNQRIKSPIWGYVFFAFVASNWKSLYYIFFSGKPALMKFKYFDANTTWFTLAFLPVIIGLLAALAAPYVSNFGSWWATKPTNARRMREVNASHEIQQAKNKLLAERDNEKAIYEQSLIDQAKRDEEVRGIEDKQLRENLEEKILASRDSDVNVEYVDARTILEKLSEREKAVISSMGEADREIQTWALGNLAEVFSHNISKVIGDSTKIRLRVELEDSLGELKKVGLAKESSSGEWSLTSAGYRAYDRLR